MMILFPFKGEENAPMEMDDAEEADPVEMPGKGIVQIQTNTFYFTLRF